MPVRFRRGHPVVSAAEDRHALIERRDAMRARLEAIAADIARGLDRDSEEQAVELENAEVLDEIARVTQIELDKVEAELARLG